MVVRKVSRGRRTNREEALSQGDPPTGIPRDEGEEDLTRLLASAHPPVAPSTEFKERLFQKLAASLQEPVPQGSRGMGQLQREALSVPPRVKDRLAGFLRGIATAGRTPAKRLVLAAGAATAALFIVVMGVRLVREATIPTLVTLAMQQGRSEVVRPGRAFLGLGGPQTLTVDAGNELALAAGDEIMTGPDSQALLRLFEGSSIELASGTQLSIVDLHTTSADGGPRLTLELRAGQTFAHIASRSFASQEGLVIRTPSAKVVALSRAFGLQVVTPSHTFLSVEDGLVHLTAGDEFTEVYAGEEIDARVGQSLVARAQGPQREIAEGEIAGLLCADSLLVPGLASPGDSVDLFLNGIWTATVIADAEGKFAYPVDTTQEGRYAISARSTNRQGHVSGEVVLREFAIDCSPPPLAITSPWEPEVLSSSVVLAGRTEPGAQVTIGEHRAMVDNDGAFSSLLELAPGNNPLTIEATDQAGNTLSLYLVITVQS